MKTKAKEILKKHSDHFLCWKVRGVTEEGTGIIINAMIEFARLACEEQKKECVRDMFAYGVSKSSESVLNCKNVCDLYFQIETGLAFAVLLTIEILMLL